MNELIDLVRSLPNKGKTHIFLGNPLSDSCDKTTVEPGNSFSPGVWTCGIYTWIEVDGEFYTPELLTDKEIVWGFDGETGLPPIVESVWNAGKSTVVKSRLTHLGCEGAEGVDFCQTELIETGFTQGMIYFVIKDVGPSGGKIDHMTWDSMNNVLTINETIRLMYEDKPNYCKITHADAKFESPMAVIAFPFTSLNSKSKRVRFKVEHGFNNRAFGENLILTHPFEGVSVEEGFERSRKEWKEAIPAKVFAPDKRIEKVWERETFHILSAMECSLPRIGAVNYPIFWIRDGIIILRALDLIGRHDLARKGNEYLSDLLFGGGFGAESDAPGEGLWTLVSHAKITHDFEWLKSIFPYLEKRVEWIEKMLTAEKPIRMMSENKIPFYMNTPGVNILCLPAKNGTIHGRMDWHSPDFFINCWTEGGLRLAAEAAKILDKKDLEKKWFDMAEKLSDAIDQNLLPNYGNDRDSVIAPYPSRAISNSYEKLALKFKDWYLKNRLTDEGERNPEPMWTYFEAAQIHNAILLGFKDMAWINLDGMIEKVGTWDVSSYIEGEANGNENIPFRNGELGRGWLNNENALGGNMPHNWTSAELVNLIRTIFVVEEADTIVLCKGVPASWLKPGSKFGVENMPTDFGDVSYSVEVDSQGGIKKEYSGPKKYRFEFSIGDK